MNSMVTLETISIIITGGASVIGEAIATMSIMIQSRYFVDQIKETLGKNRALCLYPRNEKQDDEQDPLPNSIKSDKGASHSQTKTSSRRLRHVRQSSQGLTMSSI